MIYSVDHTALSWKNESPLKVGYCAKKRPVTEIHRNENSYPLWLTTFSKMCPKSDVEVSPLWCQPVETCASVTRFCIERAEMRPYCRSIFLWEWWDYFPFALPPTSQSSHGTLLSHSLGMHILNVIRFHSTGSRPLPWQTLSALLRNINIYRGSYTDAQECISVRFPSQACDQTYCQVRMQVLH